jgi:hypothetical protein
MSALKKLFGLSFTARERFKQQAKFKILVGGMLFHLQLNIFNNKHYK